MRAEPGAGSGRSEVEVRKEVQGAQAGQGTCGAAGGGELAAARDVGTGVGAGGELKAGEAEAGTGD